MGTLIDLQAARRARTATTFAFDLASPWTYLAGHAVKERFPDALWVPARGEAPRRRAAHRDRSRAARAAAAIGLRFAWPSTGRPDGTAAARAASLAAEHGRAREFALAAARLLWGWGEDLDDHAVIAQAAGIAELPLDAVLEATFDPRRDPALALAASGGAPALTTAAATLDAAALAALAATPAAAPPTAAATLDAAALTATPGAADAPAEPAPQTSSMNTISVESLRRGPSFRMRV